MFPTNPSAVRSIVKEPSVDTLAAQSMDSLVLYFANAADVVPPWGTQTVRRDAMLRELWMKEPLLKSAVVSMAVRYASLPWDLEGPTRMTGIYRNMLQGVERGKGWIDLWSKVMCDVFTQDNGGFIEIIRAEDSPTAPVVSLKHLDSAKCRRLPRAETPVRYWDVNNTPHDLKWYQVADFVEMPSPIERGYGLGVCAVSRILEAAQIMRDIRTYKSEKVGGRWNRSIHIVSGVPQSYIDDVLEKQSNDADAAGQLRYLLPLILCSISADKPVSHEEIALASLPDGFDEDKTLHWYIIELADAFMVDPQEFAPLMGGTLGTSTQSQVLAQKGRSKGPTLFMSKVEHLMNFRGILPRTVTFKYGGQDMATDAERAMIDWRRTQQLRMLIEAGIITPEIGQQMLRDWGMLKPEYLTILGTHDVTPAPAGALL